jgi:hypothetical protein
VSEHLNSKQDVAPGAKALPAETQAAFASTQGAWRFYGNDAVNLPKLVEPLQQAARTALAASSSGYALVVHDPSHLDYRDHQRKKDRKLLSNKHELGYLLQSALIVEAVTGKPIAPGFQSLTAADGQYTTLSEQVLPIQSVTDTITTAMEAVESLKLGKKLVHLADREGDSVWHFRHWDDQGRRFVAPADNERLVRHEGLERPLPEVARLLQPQMKFTREVKFKGQLAKQYVAETTICLERRACLHRMVDGQRQRQCIAGRPLDLRLVVSEIRDKTGAVLSQWLLLTNVWDVEASRIALWYYWRWRIESYFKLLKSAGARSRTLAADHRRSDCQTPADRGDGLRRGLASGARQVATSGGISRSAGAFERAADEIRPQVYRTGAAGRLRDPDPNAQSAGILRS